MDWVAFDRVFDHFHSSAFRLEVLPRYVDDEAEEFRLFLAGEQLPERSARTEPWLARLAATTAAGKTWQRVHVHGRSLTAYERFELLGFEANVDCGEDVRMANRDEHPELCSLRRDWWLFDAQTARPFVMLMDFTDVGHLRGFDVTTDRAVVDRCKAERDLALRWSVPASNYTAVEA